MELNCKQIRTRVPAAQDHPRRSGWELGVGMGPAGLHLRPELRHPPTRHLIRHRRESSRDAGRHVPRIRGRRDDAGSEARRRDATMVSAVTLLGGLVWLAVAMNPWPGIVLAGAGLLAVLLARR
jgi:hypothetical protein